MDQGSHASEPSALGSQDSVTAFEDNDVCEGDESMGSWTVEDDPPSKKSATRPSGMADLALELSTWPFAVHQTLEKRRARAAQPNHEAWWTRRHSERRRPTGAVWAARHRGVDALATALSDAIRALGPLALTRVRGKYEVSDEGAALTTLLSDNADHHKSFCRSTNEATAFALDGLSESCGGPTTLLNVRTPPGRSLAAQCLVNALHQDVPLSTNARLAWLHAALPLCIRTDENEWSLTCAARHAVGRLVSDASCSIKGSPLPRWWDADDSAVRGSKNRADRFAAYWYALRSDVLRAHRACRRATPGLVKLDQMSIIEQALDGQLDMTIKTVSSDGGLRRALANDASLLNMLGSLKCILGGKDGRSRQADQFLAPPIYLEKAVQRWHTNQPHVRASLIFGVLSSSFWMADDSQGDIALGFGPGARLLNHLVAKDAAEAAHTLSGVVKSTPSHGLATAAALIAAALEGSGKERVHRRCPSALALYLSRRDDVPSPETWSVARVAAWCACVVEGSSLGGRVALARTTEKAIRDQFGLLGDGLMHGQRRKLLEAVPSRARRVIEQELFALDESDQIPNLTEARQKIREALRAGPLSLLVDACLKQLVALEDDKAWASAKTLTDEARQAWRTIGEVAVAAAFILKGASQQERASFASSARKLFDAYLSAADAARARCDAERETSLTSNDDDEGKLLGVAAQTSDVTSSMRPSVDRLASSLPSFSVFLLATEVLQGPPLLDDDDVDDAKGARDAAACVCALCLESVDGAVSSWLRELAGKDEDLLSGRQCGAGEAARVNGDYAVSPLSQAPTKMMRAVLGFNNRWPFTTQDDPFVRPLHDLHEACLRDSSLEKWLGESIPCVTAVRLRCPEVLRRRPWASERPWCINHQLRDAEDQGRHVGEAVSMLVREAETLRREVGDAYAMPLDGAALGLALCPDVIRIGSDNGAAFRSKALEGAVPAIASLLKTSPDSARDLRKAASESPEKRLQNIAELRRRAAWTSLLIRHPSTAQYFQDDVREWLGACLQDCLRGIKGGTRRIVAPDAAGAALAECLTEAGASIGEDLLMRACQHGRSRTALALLDAGASLNTGTKSLVGAARRARCHALADELERRGAASAPDDSEAWPGQGDDLTPWSWLPDSESDVKWLCRNQIRTTPAVLNHLLAYGCLDAARLLIVEGHVDVNQRDASGLAPLHVACGLRASRWGFLSPEEGDCDAWGSDHVYVEAALSAKFAHSPSPPRCGDVGKSFALVPPREAACLLLLAAGADPDAASPIGSPLSIALRAAASSKADALRLQRDRVLWYDSDGAAQAAKGWAGSSYGAPDRVVDAIVAARHPGVTVAQATVEAASRRGHDASLKAAKALELASKVASFGLSPMTRAALAETAALKCVKALIDKGADVDTSIEARWPTALCCAAGSGQFQAVQLLVENGAKTEGALVAACGGFVRDAPSDTNVASAEVRVAGKMGSAKCVEILLRACKDEGVEPPRTAALIGAAAHGALDAARVLCKGLGGTSTVITPAIVRVDLRVKRNPTWVHEWGDHQRQHPRIGAEGLVKAWTDLDGDKRGSYPQIRRPELNEPGLCVVRWADPVNEQICRIGHEDEFWLVAADEDRVTVPPAVAQGVLTSLAGACRANDAAAVALAVDLLAFATPDRGASLLKRRSERGAVACAQLCCCEDNRDALLAVSRLPADAWTTSSVVVAAPPSNDALDLLSPEKGNASPVLGDAPASTVAPKWYQDALALCLRGSRVNCAEEVLTRLGCLQGDAYAISRPDNWRRTARDLLCSLKPCEDLQKRVMAEIGEDITIEDDVAMIEAAALGAARYIRDAPAIIRKRRIEDTSLLVRLVRECYDSERLDALLDVALASGSTVKAVVSGALQSHATRGAVDALKVLGRRLLREDAAECAREAVGCLRIALERCGGDDAGSAEMCALLVGLGADPDSVQSTLSIDQKVEARFEGGDEWYGGKIVAINDGSYAIEYDDGDREDQVPPSLIRSNSSSPSLLYEAIRHYAPRTARELLLASCTDAPFASKTCKAWSQQHASTKRVWARASSRLCLDAPSRDVSTYRHVQVEDPLTTLDKENTVPKKRKKKKPPSPVKHRLPFVARRSKGNPRPFGEKAPGLAPRPSRGMDAKSLLECTSILQDALLIGVSPEKPPPTPVEEEPVVEEPQEEPTLHGAELNVRLLDLDPESVTPSSSNAAVSKLFEDVRGGNATISVDDAADALASSTLLDEALHGPKKLWGGEESVSIDLVRRLLRREGTKVSMSAFLRTHQRLIGGAFPTTNADLALSLCVEINGSVQEVSTSKLEQGRAFMTEGLVLPSGLQGRARFVVAPLREADFMKASTRPFLISAEPPPCRRLTLDVPHEVDAGDAFRVVCTAADARGRAVRGGTCVVRCAGPAAKEVEATFDDNGTANVSIKLPRAGTYAVTGVVGAATSFEHSLVVCSGVISKLKVSFDTASTEDDEFGFLEETKTDIVAGDALPSIRIEAQDASNNLVKYAGSCRVTLKSISPGKWLGEKLEDPVSTLQFVDGIARMAEPPMAVRSGSYAWECEVKDVTTRSDVFEVKHGPCVAYRPMAPRAVDVGQEWALKLVPCDSYGNVLDGSEAAKIVSRVVEEDTAPPLQRSGFRVVEKRRDGQLKLRKIAEDTEEDEFAFEDIKRGARKAFSLDGPSLSRAGLYDVVVKSKLGSIVEKRRSLLVMPGAPSKIVLSVDVDEDSPIKGDDLLRCRAVVVDSRGNPCTSQKYMSKVQFRLAALKPIKDNTHVMAHLQTNWNDDELEVDQGTVDYEARPALSGVFCVVATGSFATKGSHGDQELESGVSTSFCVLSGPPRSLKFEPFHVVNHSANVSLTLVDGNDVKARVDGAYAVRLVLIKPDGSEVDCGERPVFRGAVEFYGVAVPDIAGKYTFEALLMKGDEELSRRESTFHVQEKIPSVDESVQRRLAIRAKKKACEVALRNLRVAAGWTGGLDAKALRRPRFKVDPVEALPKGEEALARGRPAQDWKVPKWLQTLAKYEVALEDRIQQLVKDERAARLAPTPAAPTRPSPREESPTRTYRRKASKACAQACEGIVEKQLATLSQGGAPADADEGARLSSKVGPALRALMEARRDRDQVRRLEAYDRGEARRVARRALDATPGRLEAVLDAHRARKRSWRLLSVGDYDVDADGPVELLPRPEAAVRAITERIATDLASAANFACQRQRKRHAYTRLGDVYCRVVAGGHIDAADAAVVALLRGAAAKAYGARAAQRRDPGVVSLRVERQGALVEIDVALRDVRGLADDATAYRALLATAEEVEAPAPSALLFSPVLSPSPAAPEAPVPANAPAPAEEEEDLDVLEAVSILVEKGKRSRRVLGPDHPLTVEVLGQLEQALSPTSPFSPTSPLSAAPAPAAPLTVDDV